MSRVAVKGTNMAVGPSISQSRKCSRRRVVGRNVRCRGIADGRKITGKVIGTANGTTGGNNTTSVG